MQRGLVHLLCLPGQGHVLALLQAADDGHKLGQENGTIRTKTKKGIKMITQIDKKDKEVMNDLADLIDTRARLVFRLMYSEYKCNPPMFVVPEGYRYPEVKCDKCGHWINRK